MRASAPDFTVEVRDRDFARLGQVAPEYTDLKFTDVFNGVGAWEMKLPAEHRLLPVLKTKGSGIIITEHWTESTKQPPVYGAWSEVRRNFFRNPAAVSASGFTSSSGQASVTHTGAAVRYNFLTAGAIGLQMNVSGLTGAHKRLLVRARASKPMEVRTRINEASGNESTWGTLGTEWTWINYYTTTAGTTGNTGLVLRAADHEPGDWIEVDRVLVAEGNDTGEWFDPSGQNDTDVRRARFVDSANASDSVVEERTRTPQPDLVEHKYRVYSGRMRSARLSQDAADPKGTWVVSGVHDNVIAAATTVFPDPAHDADEQTASHWELSAAGETVMKEAVRLNAGVGALPDRRYTWLLVKPNLLRGANVKTSSRFDALGDLLTSLGTAAGLGWRFAQNGDFVEFDVYEPADKTKLVRLDIRNGGVESNELGFTAPSATRVMVMGQGEGAERTILPVTTPEAEAEAEEWGIRWESTKDQRQTDDPVELEQAGLELVTEQGVTVNSLKVVPSDSPRMRLGVDWYIGDRITAVVEGQETTALVTQVATSISSAGVIRQATVGDPTGFSFDAKVASKVKDVERRIGQVERLVGQGTAWDDVAGKPVGAFAEPGDIKATARTTPPPGWLVADGSSLLRSAYPALFAAIGTTYGAADSTHFNLPNYKGRTLVGLDTSQTEFNVVGKVGGAKTHTLTFTELPKGQGTVWSWGQAGNVSLNTNPQAIAQSSSGNGLYTQQNDPAWDQGAASRGQPHNNLQPYATALIIIKT
ncbi:minor tail protein [Microbacterium phage Katzastrophic]|uniref:minor tail protein n=1 Tax=Microbacterium phage Katzastrophic TaxID=2912654 RepID=UPI0024325BF8|nr:minor tail protein [Microbacterium phage Katzastrophic]UKH48454.1 minor tail protein [Microbacterium phage Katzastrophic]